MQAPADGPALTSATHDAPAARPVTTPRPVERFPLVGALASLTATAAVGVGVLAWVTARLFDAADAQAAMLVGSLTAYGATMVSLVPVALLARRGVMALVAAYFVGAAVRLVGCIAVVAAALIWWEMPPAPLVLGLGLYLPLLFLETGFIGWHLWRKDDPAMPEKTPVKTTERSP